MRFKLEEQEKKDLLISWAVLSLLFVVVFSGISGLADLRLLAQSLFVVGTAFVLHELAHKIVAQRFGCYAVFRADYSMLAVSFIFAFLGFLFAAPGAVHILGHLTQKKNGLIAAAGPAVNIVLGSILFLLGLVVPIFGGVFIFGAWINAYLAAFNLLPFGQFDGAKIFAWNKSVWGSMLLLSGLLLIGLYV